MDENNKIRTKDVRKCLTALNPANFFHILMLQASFTGYEFFSVLKTDWAGHPRACRQTIGTTKVSCQP